MEEIRKYILTKDKVREELYQKASLVGTDVDTPYTNLVWYIAEFIQEYIDEAVKEASSSAYDRGYSDG